MFLNFSYIPVVISYVIMRKYIYMRVYILFVCSCCFFYF
ncbi:hypothetical protein BAZSYMA_ACONTIG10304_0 [Bathymodiolus azoricus thioautotrophic gill symbiont]|uniref:Uncharacterized protein n=1 Tax=Bathymodiolus azoricus thioautotrophic gill symbiont TaxID=235205 RepID=A0A1H6MDZ0_9GAMM|nr:hypothetical protein BAZSYMA_ACONTIG10304_0 [Bathymodiolus azoricus thioautotrophic gill symbiont]